MRDITKSIESDERIEPATEAGKGGKGKRKTATGNAGSTDSMAAGKRKYDRSVRKEECGE